MDGYMLVVPADIAKYTILVGHVLRLNPAAHNPGKQDRITYILYIYIYIYLCDLPLE